MSVSEGNSARRLYEREGFVRAGEREGGSITMIKSFAHQLEVACRPAARDITFSKMRMFADALLGMTGTKTAAIRNDETAIRDLIA